MTKEQLIEIVKKLLQTDTDLDFLFKLSKSELETLVAAVRNRVESFGESWPRLVLHHQIKLYPLNFDKRRCFYKLRISGNDWCPAF